MPSSTSSNFHKPRLIASNITVQELHSPKLSHRFCCFATLALLEIHPAKLTMEPKNEGLVQDSDDFPFQLGDVSGFKINLPGVPRQKFTWDLASQVTCDLCCFFSGLPHGTGPIHDEFARPSFQGDMCQNQGETHKGVLGCPRNLVNG